MVLGIVSLAGICRNTDIAEHNSALHWYTQEWWLLCSTWSVSCHLYCTVPYMGSAQHICTQCNCYNWCGVYLLAGNQLSASPIPLSFVHEFHLNAASFWFLKLSHNLLLCIWGGAYVEVVCLVSVWMLEFWGCQVVGGTVIVILLPLVAKTTQPASYVFTHFELGDATTGIRSGAYAILLSWLVSQYSLYGYDAAAHLTEETKGADINGPIAILSSIGLISVFGWGFILALTFSIQVILGLKLVQAHT